MYLNKFYFSFSKLLHYINIGLFNSVLPFDMFNSNLILDFEKSFELIYGSFYNYYDQNFSSNSFRAVKFIRSSEQLLNRDINLLAPIGYVCHRGFKMFLNNPR